MGENGGKNTIRASKVKMHNLLFKKCLHDLNPVPSTIVAVAFTEKKVNIHHGQTSHLIYLSKTKIFGYFPSLSRYIIKMFKVCGLY